MLAFAENGCINQSTLMLRIPTSPTSSDQAKGRGGQDREHLSFRAEAELRLRQSSGARGAGGKGLTRARPGVTMLGSRVEAPLPRFEREGVVGLFDNKNKANAVEAVKSVLTHAAHAHTRTPRHARARAHHVLVAHATWFWERQRKRRGGNVAQRKRGQGRCVRTNG